MIPDAIAWAWLGKGWKYRASEWAADREVKGSWTLPFSAVLRAHGLGLNDAPTLHLVVERFRGRVNWKPDEWFQLRDLVSPPLLFLAAGGDDCDGMAMFLAQAVDFALGPLGWRSRIVSVLARPFVYSHHFAVAADPKGKMWPLQPYPSQDQPAENDVIWPRWHTDFDAAARDVLETSYKAQALALDVRDCQWRVIEPWRRVRA